MLYIFIVIASLVAPYILGKRYAQLKTKRELENIRSKSIEKADKDWPDDKFKRDYEKIPSIVILIRTYFHINQYNKGFEIFYDAYSDMADILSESYLDEVVNMMKSENEKMIRGLKLPGKFPVPLGAFQAVVPGGGKTDSHRGYPTFF